MGSKAFRQAFCHTAGRGKTVAGKNITYVRMSGIGCNKVVFDDSHLRKFTTTELHE